MILSYYLLSMPSVVRITSPSVFDYGSLYPYYELLYAIQLPHLVSQVLPAVGSSSLIAHYL
jgi:hypothetical protein